MVFFLRNINSKKLELFCSRHCSRFWDNSCNQDSQGIKLLQRKIGHELKNIKDPES